MNAHCGSGPVSGPRLSEGRQNYPSRVENRSVPPMSSVGCSRFGPNDEVETSPVETPRPQVKTSVATSFRQTKREASLVLADVRLRPLRAVPWADRDSSFLPARLDDGSRQGRRGSNELDALLFVRDSLLRKSGNALNLDGEKEVLSRFQPRVCSTKKKKARLPELTCATGKAYAR